MEKAIATAAPALTQRNRLAIETIRVPCGPLSLGERASVSLGELGDGWGARIRTWDGGSKVRCLTTWPRPSGGQCVQYRLLSKPLTWRAAHFEVARPAVVAEGAHTQPGRASGKGFNCGQRHLVARSVQARGQDPEELEENSGTRRNTRHLDAQGGTELHVRHVGDVRCDA